MPLQQLVGAFSQAKLLNLIGSADTSFTVQTGQGAGAPTGGVNGNFVMDLDRGTPVEEKILCSSRSSDTFTVVSRGYDGTTPGTHAAGASVDHVFDAALIQDLNKHVYDVTRDDHTQYQRKSLLTAAGDIPYATAASAWARLPIGAALQALGVNAGATAPQWVASLQSLLTAAGDIIYASGPNTPARLPKGADGQVLTLAAGLPSWATGLSLATAGGVLGGDYLISNTFATFLTTASLATGTWLVTITGYAESGTTLQQAIDVKIALGTATATFLGPVAVTPVVAATAANYWGAFTITVIVSVTVAGTLVFQAIATNQTGNPRIVGSSWVSSTPGACGYTAVKIA